MPACGGLRPPGTRARATACLEVGHALEQASGKRVPYVVTDRRPGDVAACYADPTLAERELHWRAQYGIDKMCADSWNFVSKQAEE